jgi:TrmH family RNA methyltransferase
MPSNKPLFLSIAAKGKTANLEEIMLSKNERSRVKTLHTQKGRETAQLFIAEGVKLVSEIMRSNPGSIQCLYASQEFMGAMDLSGIHHVVVDQDELAAISTQQHPNQVLAVCHYFKNKTSSFQPQQQVAFYLDDIRDPGNLGTMVRVSDWFGMTTLFCSPTSCDWYNPKVIQSTMGAFLRVTVVYEELSALTKQFPNMPVYGAVLNGADVYSTPLTPGLLVIGNEAHGISQNNLQLVSHPLTIPAHTNNGTESLNAAMAAGIMASEFFRQLR